ncbi:hypothetical protein [Luteimonas sp. TWI1437]|uniref:hypothetical protein n=1 Tax=unclassified Luteimonas TaxID=2629088 RepID=UPI003208F719
MTPPDMARMLGSALLLALATTACARDTTMDHTDRHDALLEAATAAGTHGEDIEILRNTRLNHAGCQFHTALVKDRFDAPERALATLPDGTVVAAGDAAGLARLLSTCGADAPADWWADVVARFADAVEGKAVHARNAADIEAIAALGGAYAAPSLERTGAGAVLRFVAIAYEPTRAAEVVARLQGDAAIEVTATPVAR